MASTSRSKSILKEDDQEEELGHFDDFTLASSWERFISEIEAVCRQWLADGPKHLLEKGAVCSDISESIYKVKSDLKYALKNYIMEYYFETRADGKGMDWISTLHDLQQSFGVKDFLVIAPQSASGVVLDAPEASKLLSAVAIALSNCSCLWPAFVPVHDPSRKAYIGIQSMGTIFTRRFEADHIGSQVPIKLMHLEGLYELFVSKFVYTAVDLSMHLFNVHFRMKLTYRTLPAADDDELLGSDVDHAGTGGSPELQTRNKIQWYDDCPWSKWYSAEDPVKGLELICVWQEKTIESSMDMAELENVSPLEADKWFISPNLSYNLVNSAVDAIGFTSQLRLLVNTLPLAFEVKFMEDFVSVESSRSDTVKSSAVIPPPTVLDRVLKELFHDAVEKKNDFVESEHKNSRAIKGAPLQSLFSQFCMHALWFGNCNIRAIAVLWIEFVREVAWCWAELQPLPRMPVYGTIDLSTCLINQKLHMLAICIEKKRQHGKKTKDVNKDEDFDSPNAMGYPDTSLGVDKNYSGERDRRGSAGIVGMMLLNSRQLMHAPITQDPPLMTEDMHDERLQAVEAFSSSTYSFSAQLEKEILSSDMSAFKAANPDAVFEDFIRWHSPRDWEDNNSGEMGASQNTSKKVQESFRDSQDKHSGGIGGSQARFAEILNKNWPPRGKLSERMSENGNSWRKIWNEASPLPACEQKPLLDPNREGEKVVHYLETLRPHQVLEQMICTAFRAAADTLSQTTFGDLTMMTTKIEQLYATIASTLRSLHGNSMSVQNEIVEDLDRLCVVFGHVEKLIILAASLHHKFFPAPRISEAIFSNFFKSYLPYMGMGLLNNNSEKKEFSMKLEIMMQEREAIVNMFPPPSANQSWRKVLSMGNLLNGHEPIFREIIFSKRDHVSSSSYYAASNNNSGGGGADQRQQEIETYRMYTCGTSNDLRVALAVTSCD